MSAFARGTRARGRCDRCGFNVLLSSLRDEIVDKRRTGLKVCEDCYDEDHPQLQRGKFVPIDPQALADPRPDNERHTSTSYFGWSPIGNPITNKLTIYLGTLTVVVGS